MRKMKKYELVIIGGGSAGLAAACAAKEKGVSDILILERDKELGGILMQCIHNGFGLHYFKEELSGPAYAERWIKKIEGYNIEYKLNTMVINMTEDKEITYVNPEEGYKKIKAKAIILAMGCRERTRGAVNIPGYRPAGIWSAGTAQRYLNLEGYLVGKKVFILGSGDIGLIMARRMTLEGAEVLGVAEIMPHSNGLPRNIQQCLKDFDIPLYLSHTVTNITGKERVEGIEITEVDEDFKPKPGTEKHFDCDTLLLSVGLIPENNLTEEAGIRLDKLTKGAICDNNLETEKEGIFACGNVLHVHDLVDFVSEEGVTAGKSAAEYLIGNKCEKLNNEITVEAGEGLGYVIPHKIKSIAGKKIKFSFRVKKEERDVSVTVKVNGEEIKRIKRKHMLPAEMENITIMPESFDIKKAFKITIDIEE